jgi:acetyltransferase-like isoleucine patch superfamily enzyme
VWLRNYDMHAMHDLRTGARISRPPLDTVIERHVWLGQDALLLNCACVGKGSIIGARSVVKGVVPQRVVAAGTPARVVREGVSWGRHPYGMSGAERMSIGLPELPEH